MFNNKKNASGLIAALTLGALGALTLGIPASAAPSLGNIDPAAEGSITIHKFETPTGGPLAGDNNSGVELDGATTGSWTPLPGVTFEVVQVTENNSIPIDLTTAQGWNDIDGLAAETLTSPVLGAPSSMVTDANGEAFWGNLPVGMYLVTETDKPAHVTSTIAPFLVTIPTPNDSAWNYDVHVYPKNSTASLNKTVEDVDQKGIGDDIVWSINTSVPAVASASEHTRFEIADNLPDEVTYVSSSVMFDTVVADPTWYTITVSSEGDPTLALTAAGLLALDGVSEVHWDITTTVDALPEGGVLANEATGYVNDSDPLTDSAEQAWGGVNIIKVAENCTTTPENDCTLEGAEFQLFKTADDAANKVNPIFVDGVDTFVTDADGLISINAVQVGTYYLAETQAPAGYTLSPTVTTVEITVGGVADFLEIEIENAQKPAFEIPALGSTGLIGVTIAGTLLIISGAAVMLVNRRRAHNPA